MLRLWENFTHSVTFYVLGAAIPNATISNRLVSLYASGATPGLPKGMACRESSYHQFVQAYMMGATGLWPNGSNLGTLDQFVGLMQVPNNMSSAFDWYTNTSTGLSIFGSKLAAVQSYVSGLRAQHSSLPNLTGSQYEDNQLIRYCGWWSGDSTYYWIPNAAFTGWVANPNSPGYSYVNDVRNKINSCG